MNLKKMTPNVMVENVNATVAWYRDVLGFALLTSVPEEGQFDWAMMKGGEVELMFQTRASLGGELPLMADRPIGGALTFYTDVEEVQGWYDRLKNQVQVVQDMHTTFYGA